MPNALPADSVGIVTPQVLSFSEPLLLACGKTLDNYQIVYETYGQLNANHSNAILICHALSGHHHAAGYHSEDDKRPGWWDAYIGPGKPIDTNKFFVVALNNIGGCHGSTGPKSINPENGKERKVVSTLDQYQYPQYYPLFKGEVANYVDSWMCWGNFSYYQKICPNPKASAAPASSANISPNQKPISGGPAS